MSKKSFLFVCFLLLDICTGMALSEFCNKTKGQISDYQDDLPSYQCTNAFGKFDHCLRACQDLPAGVVVGSARFAPTENEFIALHESKEFRHVAIRGLKRSGAIAWGRVQGKMALVNHACEPNCELSDTGDVITLKDVKESEELTIAYDAPIIGLDWNQKWNFECLCKSEHCRKKIDGYDCNKKPRKLNVVD